MTESDMTATELAELVDLYVDDALPEALRARLEAYLAAHPDAARDASTLRETVTRLHAASAARPDGWFVERALDSLLREHYGAEEPLPALRNELLRATLPLTRQG